MDRTLRLNVSGECANHPSYHSSENISDKRSLKNAYLPYHIVKLSIFK